MDHPPELRARPAWVGVTVDVVAILAALVLVALGAATGREALAWIAVVQSGRLWMHASRIAARRTPAGLPRPPEPPSESGLVVALLVAGELARDLFARAHVPHA